MCTGGTYKVIEKIICETTSNWKQIIVLWMKCWHFMKSKHTVPVVRSVGRVLKIECEDFANESWMFCILKQVKRKFKD